VPVLGVVTVPALGLEYWGTATSGAFRRRGREEERLRVMDPPEEKRVVASKNHMNEETERFIEGLWAASVGPGGEFAQVLPHCRRRGGYLSADWPHL